MKEKRDTINDLVRKEDVIEMIRNAYNPKHTWVNRDGIIRRIKQMPSEKSRVGIRLLEKDYYDNFIEGSEDYKKGYKDGVQRCIKDIDYIRE